MKSIKLKQFAILMMSILALSTIFSSCKRSVSYSSTDKTFDNSQTTQGTIYGQIVDENGSPIKDAIVKTGTHSITTGSDGMFYFSKITTPQSATLITVSKSNYFAGYRTLHINTGKTHYTRIMMMEMKNPLTFNAITGGTVNINGGGTVTFPTDAIVYKDNGTPYKGTVTVYSKWIDPTGNNLNTLMPGDLRAVDANQIEKILQTYGMMAVELFDNSGQALQIANSKTAQLSFPIPASLSANAPASIPLWYFDTNMGMWKQEGSASKQGSNYVGDVKHFSFWNCDMPGNFVNFDMTLTDNTSSPIANMLVKITDNATGAFHFGYTNSAGYVSGLVPDNANLLVEVIMSPCGNVLYSQSINTGITAYSMGTVIVTPPALNTATLSGTVLDCSGNPVANGFVSVSCNGMLIVLPTNTSGVFNGSVILCTLPASATIKSYDLTNMVSDSIVTTLTTGPINLGGLYACSSPIQYINWTSTVGTTVTTCSIVEPNANFSAMFNGSNLTQITGADSLSTSSQYISFAFDGLDNTAGAHTITGYTDHLDNNCTPVGSIPVSLVNYQPIGGFISGHFTGSMSGTIPTRIINCSFNVKHN